jgi:predicted nucleic acid-binding protein
MRYVLDSSVALKWVLPEPDAARAVLIRQAMLAGRHDLIAPDIFAVEVAHALTKAERRRQILSGEAVVKMADIFRTAPLLDPYLPLLPRAVELASQARIGVYDCLYVALAEREGCALVTADERLKRALPGSAVLALDEVP